jgi:hypothetical protein
MQDARIGQEFFRIFEEFTQFKRLTPCHAPIKACYDRVATPGFHNSIAVDFS